MAHSISKSSFILVLWLILALPGLTGCGVAQAEPLPYVDLRQREPLPAAAPVEITPLHVAVASVISPRGTVESYQPLLNYLSRRLDRPVELIQRRTYAEVNDLIKAGQVDLAFVCTSAYVIGQSMQATLATVTGQLLLTTIAVSVAGVVAGIFLTWIITRPVLNLVAVTQAVARGDLSQKAPHWADDEIGWLSDSFNAMIDDLAAARAESEAINAELLRRNRELAALNEVVREKEAARGKLLEKIITAQEEERKRIARELHDDTSQALTSLKVGLKVLEGLHSPEQIQSHLAGLREVVAQTLESVHDLALELRPSVLDDLGLVAALERYIAEYQRRFGLQVMCQVIGFEGRRLPPTIETALYRIVQEALINVLLEWNNQHLRAIVEDDGCGFEAAGHQERKLGLYGMEERATLIGGALKIESQPDLGTMVVVTVPASAMSPLAPNSTAEVML